MLPIILKLLMDIFFWGQLGHWDVIGSAQLLTQIILIGAPPRSFGHPQQLHRSAVSSHPIPAVNHKLVH